MSSATPDPDVTRLFLDWRAGDQQALEALVPALYDDLHAMAHRFMRRERVAHTLQATALVNEAFLQLFGPRSAETIDVRDRLHFHALAARLMRRILVDHARARGTQKRGGDRERVSFDQLDADPKRPADLIALDDALRSLEEFDPMKGRVIELRYFAGLTIEETAIVTELSNHKVWEETELAKAWLFRELAEE